MVIPILRIKSVRLVAAGFLAGMAVVGAAFVGARASTAQASPASPAQSQACKDATAAYLRVLTAAAGSSNPDAATTYVLTSRKDMRAACGQ